MNDREMVYSFSRLRRLMVDFRMLPLLGLLYAVALIDRINLGVARTAGMLEDLVSHSSIFLSDSL